MKVCMYVCMYVCIRDCMWEKTDLGSVEKSFSLPFQFVLHTARKKFKGY